MQWNDLYISSHGATIWHNARGEYTVTWGSKRREPVVGTHSAFASAALDAGVPLCPAMAAALTRAEEAARRALEEHDSPATRKALEEIILASVHAAENATREKPGALPMCVCSTEEKRGLMTLRTMDGHPFEIVKDFTPESVLYVQYSKEK